MIIIDSADYNVNLWGMDYKKIVIYVYNVAKRLGWEVKTDKNSPNDWGQLSGRNFDLMIIKLIQFFCF